MMKYFVKALILCLVLSLVLVGTTACTTKTVDKAGDTGSTTDSTKTGGTADEDKGKEPEMKVDFGGRKITIAAWWDLKPPAPGTSASGDALLERIADLEKKFNFKFDYFQTGWAEFPETFTASVMAGDPIAEIAFVETRMFYPNFVTKGYLVPVDGLPGFDFTDEKWDRTSLNASMYNGRIYSVSTGRPEARTGILFNKRIFKEEGLPDPYELQATGQWTWEKVLEIAKKVTRDTNGDSEIDQWALAGNGLELAFVYSNGGEWSKTIDGREVFTMGEPEALEGLQEYQRWLTVHKVIYTNPPDTPWNYYETIFQQGQIAMLLGEAYMADNFRNAGMADEIGYVMFPKGPKSDDYVTYSGAHNFQVFVTGESEEFYEKLSIMWNEYTEPYPEDVVPRDAWKETNINRFNDTECLRTVEMMLDGRMKILKFDNFAGVNQTWWNSAWKLGQGETTPGQLIDEVKDPIQKIMDDIINQLKAESIQ